MCNEINVIYIIGNGFDLHHGLPTRFTDYKKYLSNINKTLVEKIDRLFYDKMIEESEIELWADLENDLFTISQFDVDYIYEESFSSSIQDMDKSSYMEDPGINAYSLCKEQIKILKFIKDNLNDWVNIINKDIEKINKKSLELQKNSFYINFNYTNTLERLYLIENKNIWHIHGSNKKECIIGYNERLNLPYENPEIADMDYNGDIITGNDYRCVTVKENINNATKELYYYYSKSSIEIINNNKKYFDRFNTANKIIFMGLSMGKQDQVYINEIANRIKENCEIVIYYYKEISDDIWSTCNKYFKNRKIIYKEW